MLRLSMLLLIIAHLCGYCGDAVKLSTHGGSLLKSDYENVLFTEGIPAYRITISTTGNFGIHGINPWAPVYPMGFDYEMNGFVYEKYIPTPETFPVKATNIVFSVSNHRGIYTNSDISIELEYSKSKDINGTSAYFDTYVVVEKLHPSKTEVENSTIRTSPYTIGGEYSPWTNYVRAIRMTFTTPAGDHNMTNFFYQGYTTEVH